ncbi:MAG: hypothetical protein AABP62_28620 [Planctomycetota bacterium]
MQPKTPRDLLQVDPKDRSQYGDFSLVHLTAYSVQWLNTWSILTSYENISILNGRLFPADFGMAGFPEFPDGLRTNRSLLQMRPKYRGFATSDPRRGVYLTERGLAEVAKVIEAIGPPSFEGKQIQIDLPEIDPRRTGKGKERSFNAARYVEEHKNKLLYRRHYEGQLAELDVIHLLGLLDVYDHTPPSEVRKEFKRLRDAADATSDIEFLKFMDAVAERFQSYLDRPNHSRSRA